MSNQLIDVAEDSLDKPTGARRLAEPLHTVTIVAARHQREDDYQQNGTRTSCTDGSVRPVTVPSKKPRRRVLPHQRVNTEFIRTSLEGRAVAVREVWTQACTLLCQRERCRYAGPHGGHDSSFPPREMHTMYHWLRNLVRTRPPRRPN